MKASIDSNRVLAADKRQRATLQTKETEETALKIPENLLANSVSISFVIVEAPNGS